MQQALLVRLRPLGPWRYGPSDGALDSVDALFRSDRLFSAVTLAMRQLGMLDSWLDATARAEKPAVSFTSLFPFQGDTLFVTPPAHLWPPPSTMVTSPSPGFLTKIRWRAAHFVPMSLMDSLLTGQPVLADQWIPDPESGCLLRRDRPSSSPFRTVARAFAPVDRLRLTASDAHVSACVEFESGSGLWTVARLNDDAAEEAWREPLKAAFRLLGDTGFGGGRSKGWGQVQPPEFENGTWPGLILPKVGRAAKNDVHQEQTSRSYWLMSLYSPAAQDTVNWSGGQYELTIRNGRVDGASGALKKSVRMVTEGCILDAASEPIGTAVDVAPEGFAHSVYRSGIALALLIPPPKPVSEDRRPIETIVPPELEATPFPMPSTVESEPEVVPEPEPVSEAHVEPPTQPEPEPQPEAESQARSDAQPEPEAEPESEIQGGHGLRPVEAEHLEGSVPVHEPETEPEPLQDPEPETAPVEEPQEDPAPVHEPEPEPVPVHEPEAASEPVIEVVPEDTVDAEHSSQEPDPEHKTEGYDI